MLKRFSLLVVLSCLCQFSFGQLANIESQRIKSGDKRLVADANLRFGYHNPNGNYWFNVGAGLNTLFKNKDFSKMYLVIGEYNLTRSKNEDLQDNWFLHFRFNNKMEKIFKTDAIRFEAFVQTQSNKRLDIDTRNLIGTGLRFKIGISEPGTQLENRGFSDYSLERKPDNKHYIVLYIGNSYMYEYEKSERFDAKNYNHRNSAYASLKIALNNGVNITNNTYYQPLYKDFGNYNLLEQLIVSTPVSRRSSLTFSFDYWFDSEIPGDDKRFQTDFSVGLRIKLEKETYN